MRIADVLKKERSGKGLSREGPWSVADMANALGVAEERYRQFEAGDAGLETWFPLLCRLAVALERPPSRLLAPTGRSTDCRVGAAGALIRAAREASGVTAEEIASQLGIGVEEYTSVEQGDSPIEDVGPVMLRFAEVVGQPLINVYLPCGVRYDELDDYP